MTAINVACQKRHNLVQILTDGAAYNAQGDLLGVGTKVFAEPNWPGVVIGRGKAIAVPLLGAALSLSFSTFDAIISGARPRSLHDRDNGCEADRDHARGGEGFRSLADAI
jgi:hypothetical protein